MFYQNESVKDQSKQNRGTYESAGVVHRFQSGSVRSIYTLDITSTDRNPISDIMPLAIIIVSGLTLATKTASAKTDINPVNAEITTISRLSQELLILKSAFHPFLGLDIWKLTTLSPKTDKITTIRMEKEVTPPSG